MLPDRARLAVEEIGRSRREREGIRAKAAVVVLPAKAHHARSEERHADDLAEHGRVPVPANACARGIAGGERLGEGIEGDTGEAGGALANGIEIQRDIGGALDGPGAVAILPPVVDDGALGGDPVHSDLPEGERFHRLKDRALLFLRDEVGDVEETGRSTAIGIGACVREQAELLLHANRLAWRSVGIAR